jgi:hypothetical protein
MIIRVREYSSAPRELARWSVIAGLVLLAGTARAEGSTGSAAAAPSARTATSAKPASAAPDTGEAAKRAATSPAAKPAASATASKTVATGSTATGAAATKPSPAGAPASAKPAATSPAKPVSTAPARAAIPAAPTKSGPAATPTRPAARPNATAAKPPASAPAGKPADAVSAAKTSLVVTRPATRGNANATGVAASGSGVAVPRAQLDEHVTYQYNTLGRRDPFQSLVEGDFVGEDVGGDAPPDVGGIKVVGIVWGSSDRFAMVEDPRGNSHVLREGDKVMNGYVQELKRDGMVVNLTVDGQSESVTIPLTRKGDNSNANR